MITLPTHVTIDELEQVVREDMALEAREVKPVPSHWMLAPTTNEALLDWLEREGISIDLWIADPNWPYMQTGGGDPSKFRSTAKREYSEGDYGTIAATLARAARVSTEHAALGLWVTAPQKMDVARRVVTPLEDWGAWRYQCSIYWHKTGAPGIGQWLRNDVEELWILSRSGRLPVHLRGQIGAREKGDTSPSRGCFRNWLEAAMLESYSSPGRGKEIEHSEKPEGLERKVIDRFCPATGVVGSLWSGMFSTGRAARAAGRDCYGAEPDPDRREMAIGKMEGI